QLDFVCDCIAVLAAKEPSPVKSRPTMVNLEEPGILLTPAIVKLTFDKAPLLCLHRRESPPPITLRLRFPISTPQPSAPQTAVSTSVLSIIFRGYFSVSKASQPPPTLPVFRHTASPPPPILIPMEEELTGLLGNNSIEDASWLCSLSETELDMLITLKMLVLQRAKVIGHEELAQKFDLKMLRALGLILMECVKEKIEGLSHIPGLSNARDIIDGCNILKSNSANLLSVEELKACIVTAEKKRRKKRPREETTPNGKNKDEEPIYSLDQEKLSSPFASSGRERD
ncbi:hypothetical protein Tsubulata_023918, partial [Turnera subulata]